MQVLVYAHPRAACGPQTSIHLPNVGKYIFFSRQEIRDSFGYFLGQELSQTIALDLGIVCPALYCGDVHIVLVSLTLSVMCILDIIWS